jgi:pimeloyl-ACP methyl ester carboxylesterase
LVVIPRAGHVSTLEEPAEVSAALADHLARVRRAGGGA